MAIENLAHPFRLGDGGGEYQRPPVANDLKRRADHAVQVFFLFHDFCEVRAVQVARRGPHAREVKPLDDHKPLVNRHEPARVNGIENLVIHGDGFAHLPERLFVGAVGRGGDVKEFDVRVLAVVIHHPAVAGGRAVVALVHDHDAELLGQEFRHTPESVAAGRLGLYRRYDDLRPSEHAVVQVSAQLAHLNGDVPSGDLLDFGLRLEDQLFPMRDHEAAFRVCPLEDAGKGHGFAATGGHYEQRATHVFPLVEYGVHRPRLVVTKFHFRPFFSSAGTSPQANLPIIPRPLHPRHWSDSAPWHQGQTACGAVALRAS